MQTPGERERHLDVTADQIVDDISVSMGVPIHYDDGNRCFYSPDEDTIHLPKPEYFKTSYAFNSSALHELAHASGAYNRLNRGLRNSFGSEEYAFEELIAELTSCMISAEITKPNEDDQEYWNHHFENHAAYVQNWIKILKEDSTALERAIKQADLATDYLEMHAGILKVEEYYKKHGQENPQTVTISDSGKLIPEQDVDSIQQDIEQPIKKERSYEHSRRR